MTKLLEDVFAANGAFGLIAVMALFAVILSLVVLIKKT